MSARQDVRSLNRFAARLFEKAGMPADRAARVAALLIDADMMGHDTHGLNLAPQYLAALAAGEMPATGEPKRLSDTGPVVLWDGNYLSGVWLVDAAMDLAMQRAREFGMAAVGIRRSGHIACLQSFLPRATEKGFLVLLLSSDPAAKGVAPPGAVEAIYTPNPIAVGIPTDTDPVLIDISCSITTMGLAGRKKAEGERMPGAWLVDESGAATDDPAAGTALLPLGGTDSGHKGFALGLMVEALTSALGGFGRKDGPTQHGASVTLLLFDPEAFGGREDFTAESSFLAAACRAARVPEGAAQVRIPGERGLASKRAALADGLVLYPGIMDRLAEWAGRLGVEMPEPLN